MKVVYKTNDGKEFDTEAEAVVHERTLVDYNKIQTEVVDLLNSAILAMKDIEAAKSIRDDYSFTLDKEYPSPALSALKSILQDVVKSPGRSEEYLNQYYNSNCY